MAMLIKWLGRALLVIGGVDLIACFYFKNRAIGEMHDPACCKDAVSFTSLTDHPVLISHGTAFGYHLTEWVFEAPRVSWRLFGLNHATISMFSRAA